MFSRVGSPTVLLHSNNTPSERLLSSRRYVYGTLHCLSVIDILSFTQIPPSISFEQASTIPVGAGAAFVGLYGPKISSGGAALTPFWAEGGRGKYAGKPIVIFGGSSSVGQYGMWNASFPCFPFTIEF